MVGDDVQVILPLPEAGAHAIDLADALVHAPEHAKGGRMVWPQLVGDLVVAGIVGVDGRCAAVDVHHHAKGLHLGEERIPNRV